MLCVIVHVYWASVVLLCGTALVLPESLLARAVRLCARRGKLNLEGAVPPASDALSRIQACNAIDARITCSALPDSATSSVPAMLQALSVPHSWFSHFYLVGNVCNYVILQLATHLQFQIGTLYVLALFQVHLIRRGLESTLQSKFNPRARMHAGGYVFGLSYYVFASLSLLERREMEQLECAACDTAGCAGGLPEATTPASLFLVAGTVVFLAKQPYRLPAGDWFDLVPCGHYLAELVIYLALTIARRGNSACLLMLSAIASNLAVGARETQAWYSRHVPGSASTSSKASFIPGVL